MPRQDLPFATPVTRWLLDWERTVLIFRGSEKKILKLTQNEKEIYRAIVNTKLINKNVRNEGKHILRAIEIINSQPKPDVPMLMFISDGSQTGGESWIKALKDYASDLPGAQTIDLDCGHAVYELRQEQISEEMREFIESLKN